MRQWSDDLCHSPNTFSWWRADCFLYMYKVWLPIQWKFLIYPLLICVLHLYCNLFGVDSVFLRQHAEMGARASPVLSFVLSWSSREPLIVLLICTMAKSKWVRVKFLDQMYHQLIYFWKRVSLPPSDFSWSGWEASSLATSNSPSDQERVRRSKRTDGIQLSSKCVFIKKRKNIVVRSVNHHTVCTQSDNVVIKFISSPIRETGCRDIVLLWSLPSVHAYRMQSAREYIYWLEKERTIDR